jgi:hypothetical protein
MSTTWQRKKLTHQHTNTVLNIYTAQQRINTAGHQHQHNHQHNVIDAVIPQPSNRASAQSSTHQRIISTSAHQDKSYKNNHRLKHRHIDTINASTHCHQYNVSHATI